MISHLAIVIAFRDATEFEAWLDTHVDLQVGVWLKFAKKGSGVASLTDDEAVDLGLSYGWISGQRKAYDEVGEGSGQSPEVVCRSGRTDIDVVRLPRQPVSHCRYAAGTAFVPA